MVWYSILLKNFPQFFVIYIVKGLGIINKEEIDVVLKFSCFFYDPTDLSNMISVSSAFSKSILNIWKFMVHVQLKPVLENFKPSSLMCEMSAIVQQFELFCRMN